MLQTYLVTIALQWQDDSQSITDWYERLESLRRLVKPYDFQLQEEVRPMAIALFGDTSRIVHLGFEQPLLGNPDWYQQPDHPYVEAIAKILDAIAAQPTLKQLEFLVAHGGDPLTGLQIQLDRHTYPLSFAPSAVCHHLQTQIIYSFQHNPVKP